MRRPTPHPPNEPAKQSAAELRRAFWRPGTRSVWVPRSFYSPLVLLFAWMPLVGCASSIDIGLSTIPPAQYLPAAVPQAFRLQASAEQVWRIVSERAKSSAPCILAEAPKDRVLSWCEDAENWRDLEQDSVAFAQFAQAPGKGMAMTTVWIEDLGSDSMLHVRKVYYGSESFEGVGHSRGQDERLLYQQILYRLGMGEGKFQSREGGAPQ